MAGVARLGRAAVAAAFALGFAACSLFVDTDGLENGSVTGDASNDATGSSDVNAKSDAPSDAAPFDGSVTDGAGPAFCATHPGHGHCYDFDESTNLPHFDDSDYNSANFFVDNSDHMSAPNSLVTKYSMGDSGGGIEIDFDTAGKISVSFDFKVTSSDLANGQIVPLVIQVPSADDLDSHYFYVQIYNGSLNLGESTEPADGGDTFYTSATLAPTAPNDEWMHVDFSVDGSNGKITLAYDGTALADAQAQEGFPTGGSNLYLGAYASDLNQPAVQHVDNVTLDF